MSGQFPLMKTPGEIYGSHVYLRDVPAAGIPLDDLQSTSVISALWVFTLVMSGGKGQSKSLSVWLDSGEPAKGKTTGNQGSEILLLKKL